MTHHPCEPSEYQFEYARPYLQHPISTKTQLELEAGLLEAGQQPLEGTELLTIPVNLMKSAKEGEFLAKVRYDKNTGRIRIDW